jgi:hypothetical protein
MHKEIFILLLGWFNDASPILNVGDFARAARGDPERTITLKTILFVVGVLASALMLALVGFGFGWFLSGWQIANLKEGPGSQSAISNTTTKPDATLPKADVPGEDFSDLPRYPGSIRTKYERRVSTAGLILVDTEYVASARLSDVREFYRGVFRTEGWTQAGLDVSEGEWDFLLTKADREAVIEIEIRRGLVEIEIEVSEPQNAKEARKGSASSQRPEQAAPAPSTTPPSDGDYDPDDGSEGD